MKMSSVAAAFALTVAASPALAAGPYQVFTYWNSQGFRICKGDTTTGEALCSNGTNISAQHQGGGEPKWDTGSQSARFLLYASPFEGAKGNYQFFAYMTADGSSRVCVGDTSTGEARCSAQAHTAAEGTHDKLPDMRAELAAGNTRILRYFEGKKARPGDWSFTAYEVSSGIRVCRMRTATGDTDCQGGTDTDVTMTGGKLGPFNHQPMALTRLRFFPAK